MDWHKRKQYYPNELTGIGVSALYQTMNSLTNLKQKAFENFISKINPLPDNKF